MRALVHPSKVVCAVYISHHVSSVPSLLISSSLFTEEEIDQPMQWCATGLITTFRFLIGNFSVKPASSSMGADNSFPAPSSKVVPGHTVKTCRRRRCIAPLILMFVTRYGSLVNFTLRPLYPRGKKAAVQHEQNDLWATELLWTFWRRVKSLARAGIRTPASSRV